MPHHRLPAFTPTRRDWLRSALGAYLLPSVLRASGTLDEEASAIGAQARKAGLGAFGRTETTHFFGVGNAPGAFRAEALSACEAVAEALLTHFHEKGFTNLALPKQKLTVVILDDVRSYAAFTGQKPDLVVGGQFELDTNRLVMFDFRADQASVNAAAERINTFTLIHETTHELTFNTGLLDLKGDVPLCVSEGLATYAEVWRPRGRGRIGQVNHPRLDGIDLSRRGMASWLPLARLIADDELLIAVETQQLAYAQSWVLIHAHLKSPARLPKLRSYLAAIKPRRDASKRLADASEHLGDLARLDADLKRYAAHPLGS